MTAIISKLIIFVTVLLSLIFPADVNGAVVTVDNEVKSTDSVINFTYTNETGLVIANDSWVEKLEMKVGDSWIEINVEDEAKPEAFYVNPGDAYSDSYDAGLLLPGTYKLTVGYNVATDFGGATEVGTSSVEFEVALY